MRVILTIVVFVGLMVVIFIQQSRIRALEKNVAETPVTEAVPNTRKAAALALLNDPATAPRARQRDGDPLDKARQQHTEAVEKQLAEISAPLAADMASTMFNAVIKKGAISGNRWLSDSRWQEPVHHSQTQHHQRIRRQQADPDRFQSHRHEPE